MPSLILAAFVLAHGPNPPSSPPPPPPATADGPTWPFTLDRSWVPSRAHASTAVLRSIGLALTAPPCASFALAAMAIVGVVPQTLAPFAVVLGAGSSIGLLMLFFHP